MWKNTSEQLPKVGRDVIFTIPSENDENSTAYNGRNIDVGQTMAKIMAAIVLSVDRLVMTKT